MSAENNPARTERKLVTPEEFIVSSALYTRVETADFRAPERLVADCPECKADKTDWYRIYNPTALGRDTDGGTVPDWELKSVAYKCHRCQKAILTIIYKVVETTNVELPQRATPVNARLTVPHQKQLATVNTAVVKLGQSPQLQISLPPDLTENLGAEASSLYRKALVCRNNGYGLAAVGYMRRVVEDKTNELIDVVAQFAEIQGLEADIVSAIRATINRDKYTRYEQKLSVAAAALPDSLQVSGKNPLGVLFEQVSKALHGLSEDQCIEVADQIRLIFEYVFEKLRAEVINQRAFAKALKELK